MPQEVLLQEVNENECGRKLVFSTQTCSLCLPGSSADKESACNAGDPSSIIGLGRFAGEGIGYPLQYSWASLVAQLVRNPLAMWETWVQSLAWEDPLEWGMATRYSSIMAWRILSWATNLQKVWLASCQAQAWNTSGKSKQEPPLSNSQVSFLPGERQELKYWVIMHIMCNRKEAGFQR